MDEIEQSKINIELLNKQFKFNGKIKIGQISTYRDYFTDSFIERLITRLQAKYLIVYILKSLISDLNLENKEFVKRLLNRGSKNQQELTTLSKFLTLYNKEIGVRIYFFCKIAVQALKMEKLNISDINYDIKYCYYDKILYKNIVFDFQKEINKINIENAKNWDKCQQKYQVKRTNKIRQKNVEIKRVDQSLFSYKPNKNKK